MSEGTAGSRGSWEFQKEGPSPERVSGKTTPATGSVRRSYAAARLPMVWAVEDAEGEFDRWLESERARIWDEGAEAERCDCGGCRCGHWGGAVNPYRKDGAA